MRHTQQVKDEALRLRVEEHLGLGDISARTGVSQGTLSNWLRAHPLDGDEVLTRMRENARRSAAGLKKDRGEEAAIHQTVREHQLNVVQVAKVAEAAVLLRLLVRGFNVFGSVFDGDRTDWLVEVPAGRVWKIQVKTAVKSKTHGLPVVQLGHGMNSKAGRQRYKEGEFDFIVGYDLYTDTAYVWSWAETASHRAAITVCPEAAECWAKLLTGV